MRTSMDDREELISMECAHLRQADRFIKEGRVRLLNQQNLVSELTEGRYQIKEAQRLAELMAQTLAEWQRHRQLIIQRLETLTGVPVPPVIAEGENDRPF